MISKHNIKFPFTSFPVLQSERLSFNPISESDADRLLAIRSHESVMQYIKRTPIKDTVGMSDFIARIQRGFAEHKIIFWIIRQQSDDKIIGTMSLWHFTDDKTEAEVGYEFHPDYWGQGFADEAIKRILSFGFDVLELQKIEAFTHRDNEASKKLLLKNQFVLHPKRVDEGNGDNRIYVRVG